MKRLILATLFAGLAAGAHAAVVFTGGGTLAGAKEVPPRATPATGIARVTVDDGNDGNPNTNRFSWDVTFSNLTTPIVAAHFHGPATPDSNAPIEVPILASLLGTTGSSGEMKGSANISAGDFRQLMGGLWYVNVHSSRFPGGEIRAQILPATPGGGQGVPEPSSLALLGLALAGLAATRPRAGKR